MQSHFDNPLVEQRELLAGVRQIEFSDRAVIRIAGSDRHEWLNSMLSQRLDRLEAGQSAEALLLDAHGHVEQNLQLIEDGDSTWVICEASQLSKLLRYFDMVIFRSKVEIFDVSGDYFVLGGFGKPTADLGSLVWHDQWMHEVRNSARYADVAKREPFDLYLAIVSREQTLPNKPKAGSLAFDALRVAAHRPWQPNEIDDKTLPHELDWLSSAVHLSKGCYRGQEAVAKVHNLGHPPRRIVLLHLDGSADTDVSIGDSVWQGDREIGRVTTVANHFELGAIALAVVARTSDESAQWQVRGANGNSVSAKAETVVPPTAGAAAQIREKRAGLLG